MSHITRLIYPTSFRIISKSLCTLKQNVDIVLHVIARKWNTMRGSRVGKWVQALSSLKISQNHRVSEQYLSGSHEKSQS